MSPPVRLFIESLLAFDRARCWRLLEEARSGDFSIRRLEALVVPALEEIGRAWERGELALAEVYMAGRICEEAMASLLKQPTQPTGPGPLIGVAVLEDFHLLGKRIITSMLRSAGYRVMDYGGGVKPAHLIEKALSDKVDLLMVSVLMVHSAIHLGQVQRTLASTPGAPPLVVGGAPFRLDPELGHLLGLQNVGSSASDALRYARHFLGEPCR
nr:cobalamin-dependent protein [uncultured Holophaga sp.]